MNERMGVIVFSTANEPYLALTRLLVTSVLEFTPLSVLIIGLNGRVPYDHDRVESMSINTGKTLEDIYYAKFDASLLSPFDISVQVDSDMVASPDLLELLKLSDPGCLFPQGAHHPHDPNNQATLMNLLGVPVKSQPYVHGTYVYRRQAFAFLEECRDIAAWIKARRRGPFGYRPLNYDETILNVALWREQASDTVLPWFDPYFTLFADPSALATDPSLPEGMTRIRAFSHGQKCISCAEATFEEIRDLVTQHQWHAGARLTRRCQEHLQGAALSQEVRPAFVAPRYKAELRRVGRMIRNTDALSRRLEAPSTLVTPT